jgi:hypothetical protein
MTLVWLTRSASRVSHASAGRPPAERRYSSATIQLSVVAIIGGMALLQSGCGRSQSAVPRQSYLPPLRVRPSAMVATPGSTLGVEHALWGIAHTMEAPSFSPTEPVRFNYVEYELLITNAGSRDGFSADQTLWENMMVMPDSSAHVRVTVLTSPTPVSQVDRRRWRATGGQAFASPADHAGASSRLTLSAGSFSFILQGPRLSFRRVRKLPTSPRMLNRDFAQFLGGPQGLTPPPAMILRQYGFLLATAPLTRAARRAILEAIGSLSGVHRCAALFPKVNPRYGAFCVNGDPTSTEILIDRKSGIGVVICERLNTPTSLYPDLVDGSLVNSFTFLAQQSTRIPPIRRDN